MKLHKMLAIVFVLIAPNSYSEVTYTERKDDFSNEIVYSLKIPSDKGESAVILVTCFPGHNLNVQLASTRTMFPNGTRDGGMIISTTHKFDKAEAAITSDWYMNMMKYKNSWYRGDKIEFARQAATSNQLNIRLDKRNDIFKFPLEGTAVYLKKIVRNCGSEI